MPLDSDDTLQAMPLTRNPSRRASKNKNECGVFIDRMHKSTKLNLRVSAMSINTGYWYIRYSEQTLVYQYVTQVNTHLHPDIMGGTSMVSIVLSSSVHRLTPGLPCSPSAPSLPGRPRGPGRPRSPWKPRGPEETHLFNYI